MFRRRLRKRPTQRRKSVRRSRRRPLRVSRPRPGFNGIPARYRTKLKYVDTLTGTVTGASSTYWYFQNSLNDPYASLGGHQPYYYDQLTALYSNYRVFAMGYTVEAQVITASGHLTVATYWNLDALTAPSLSAAAERIGSRFIGFSNQYRSRLKGFKTIASLWNVSKKDVNIDDQFAAAYNADPVKKAYFFIHVFNPTASSLEVVLTARLTYYCEFFGEKTQTQS